MKRRYRRSLPGITVVFAVSLAVGLLLLRSGVSQKWEAAAFWSTVTFAAVIELSRRRWSEADFWARLSVIAAVHLLGMWLLFSHLVTGHHVPWIITLPLIWAEVVLILKIVNVQEARH